MLGSGGSFSKGLGVSVIDFVCWLCALPAGSWPGSYYTLGASCQLRALSPAACHLAVSKEQMPQPSMCPLTSCLPSGCHSKASHRMLRCTVSSQSLSAHLNCP